MGFIGDALFGGAEGRASDAQVAGIEDAIAEQRGAYGDVQDIYSPYGGFERAVSPLLGLAGLGTPEQYQQQLDIIQAGPQYQALLDAGQEQILQSAAATGGLRGGNVQRSLADFGRSALSDAISQRFGQLSGLTQTGLGVAGNLAGARTGTAGNIANLFTQRGAAEAGGILGRYGAIKDTLSGAARAAATGGLGGF